MTSSASPESFIVDEVDCGAAGAAEWDGFVGTQQSAALYHRYAWRDVVRDVFGRETHYLLARSSSGIEGVLPLARLRSRLFGDFLVSLPYFNYGGVLAATPRARDTLLDAAVRLAVSLGVGHVELRHRENLCDAMPVRTDKVTLLLPLACGSEALWKRLSSKVRAQIRRPQKEGAAGDVGGPELLDEFYEVFAENMRDLGTPVYPRRFFARILRAFPAEARICVVRLAGRPVAAGFVIGDGRTLEIPWASSLRRANPLGVNMLLYWRILEFACERGYAVFDFGRCTVDSGTYRFKRQWGAEPQQLYWHYWLRDGGELPRLNHANPRFGLAVAAWRRLPLVVANRLGPLLVRNLP
jgi:FemAB-related protein (PEP-CTERM system-associated)